MPSAIAKVQGPYGKHNYIENYRSQSVIIKLKYRHIRDVHIIRSKMANLLLMNIIDYLNNYQAAIAAPFG